MGHIQGHHDHGEGHGYHGHADHITQFKRRFWWSLLLSIPTLVFNEMFSHLLGYMPPEGTGWISPLFGLIIFFYGGWPFLTGAISEMKSRQPGMMLLIGLAITVAFFASLATSFGIGKVDLDFWWELALLIDIMLLGHWLEMRALGQASSALDALAALLPDEAERVKKGGETERIAITQLAPGDVVLVRSGARVPADGAVVEGSAEIDESMISGESKPVEKSVGSKVVAGTVATDSAVRVRVEAIGDDTALAGIQRLVEQAQRSKSRAQALADRAAAMLFYYAAASAVVTAAIWMFLGLPTEAVERTVTVLVIACPHALGLAIPLVIAISTAVSARNGILVKDRLALERMRNIDAVLFDKTGTLTKGKSALTDVVADKLSENEMLAIAGAVESDSEHPLAKAIVTAAKKRGSLPKASEFKSMTGRGVQASVNSKTYSVGGPNLIKESGVRVAEKVAKKAEKWAVQGSTVLYLISGKQAVGALALSDEIRAESRQAVSQLHKAGIKVVMITGDAKSVAESVGKELGIDEVFAEVLPEDKDSKVAELQSRGLKVAMVGDGVNDAPALARADVGIAIGAGTDVAIESAGVVLVSDDPRGVLGVIKLSKASYRKMQQNLAWATGYNLFSVPLAAGILAPIGFVLAPAVGAILMSLSTIIVAANAQLLRNVNLSPGADSRGERDE